MISDFRLRHAKDAGLYATASDFCRIFHDDMDNLYLLALLLTADAAKAEQCFASSLEQCADGNHVFKEYAGSWARRTIIKTGVRMITLDASGISAVPDPAADDRIPSGLRPEMSAVLNLQPFERFVFVVSVLEKYTDRDCTLLLGCTREKLISARTRALQQIARSTGEIPLVPSVGSTLELPVSLATPA